MGKYPNNSFENKNERISVLSFVLKVEVLRAVKKQIAFGALLKEFKTAVSIRS